MGSVNVTFWCDCGPCAFYELNEMGLDGLDGFLLLCSIFDGAFICENIQMRSNPYIKSSKWFAIYIYFILLFIGSHQKCYALCHFYRTIYMRYIKKRVTLFHHSYFDEMKLLSSWLCPFFPRPLMPLILKRTEYYICEDTQLLVEFLVGPVGCRANRLCSVSNRDIFVNFPYFVEVWSQLQRVNTQVFQSFPPEN